MRRDRDRGRAPSDGLEEERRTSPLELLWDLVFVFAVTQVTTLLHSELTWAGFGRSMLVLALIWWAWSAFVWAANAQSAGSPAMLASLLVATSFIFVTGLSLPHAFGDEGVLFAVTYAVVRFVHLALYADASRKGNASWSAIAELPITVVIGMALLIAGAFVHDITARSLLWLVAVAIDYAGPAWLTRERLRGLQRVAVAHFAERYSLFVIICLGRVDRRDRRRRARRAAQRVARRRRLARVADHHRAVVDVLRSLRPDRRGAAARA